MPSFERAVEIGVDVIETDVHLSADGHVVIAHDPDGTDAAGVPDRIAELRLEQLRAWDIGYGFVDDQGERPYAGRGLTMPTLDEVLHAFPSMRFNIDIKPKERALAHTMVQQLRRHDAAGRVCLASFHGSVIRAVRKAGYRGETVLAQDEVIAVIAAPRIWGRKLPFGGDALQIPTKAGPLDLGSESFIDKCHRFGYRVDFWTINDPAEAQRLMQRGADGMITDDPAALKSTLDRFRK
jgi:glycerophosphoryl diester phosphodiesterase